ncbi:MAG: DUF2066 domain-containing protein [Gammaproteobacteria bacterium]
MAVSAAQAARVTDLYEAEVVYQGAREDGFRVALGEVLVRMTGRRDAADRPAVAPLLDDAGAYMQQFRQLAPGRLWVAFDGRALERALEQLQQPLWGTERPSTLLWVAVDAGGGKRFVVGSTAEFEEEADIHAAIVEVANRRGLPMVFPLMDAEDRERASFAEVWGGFEDSIRAASERYGVDAVLVGRLAADDMGHGRWTLYSFDGEERWSGGVADSIERLADRFAARYAVVSSGETRTVQLAVSGLTSIEDYGRVSRFLSSLTAVQTLAVEAVERDQVLFRVALRGEPATLDEAVRLGGVLQAAGQPGRLPLEYRVAK